MIVQSPERICPAFALRAACRLCKPVVLEGGSATVLPRGLLVGGVPEASGAENSLPGSNILFAARRRGHEGNRVR